MKILTVLGARPQLIKAAMVSCAIDQHPQLQEVIVHTGQHFDQNMSEVFFNELKIPKPSYHLDVNQMHPQEMLNAMLFKIDSILEKEKPQSVLVYGDTISTLAGAVAARNKKIKVCHVEAGLRSGNTDMIEEVNRILTDRMSDLLFCPTKKAVENLKYEEFDKKNCKIIQSGDVMLDAALHHSKGLEENGLEHREFILCTVHRRENLNDRKRLENIFVTLEKIHQQIPIVLPMHPHTKKILEAEKIQTNVTIIEPVGYLEMLSLLKNCKMVMTDSGGLQKEAYFFSKPCVTLRDETEWTELVDGGYNIVSGANPDQIYQAYGRMKNHKIHFDSSLYGSGQASQMIVNEIASHV